MKEPRQQKTGKPAPALGELLALGLQGRQHWTSEELELALAEQISVPIEFELSRLGGAAEARLRREADARGLLLKNLRELLLHPRPPLELLVMVKDFFKANSAGSPAGVPPDVARVLYHLSIAVAWLRHHERISTLGDAQLAEGFRWVLAQDWIGRDLLELVREALHLLAGASDDVSPQT